MFQTSDKIDDLFFQLGEMVEEEGLNEDELGPFVEHFCWETNQKGDWVPKNDAIWLQDNDWQSPLDMMSDVFEAGLRLGKEGDRSIIKVGLQFGGAHGEESILLLFGDEGEWLAKLQEEFDTRFVVAQTMTS